VPPAIQTPEKFAFSGVARTLVNSTMLPTMPITVVVVVVMPVIPIRVVIITVARIVAAVVAIIWTVVAVIRPVGWNTKSKRYMHSSLGLIGRPSN
jgi:hypothetical protein